ncbi:MAG: hypothetical protein D6824_08575, partial [Planctomycetota bacterium]
MADQADAEQPMAHRNAQAGDEASVDHGLDAPIIWSQPPCQREGLERWRVEYRPEATVVRVNLGDIQPEAIDIFVDERGVFVSAAAEEAGTVRVAAPVPGAHEAAAPQAQLREGELVILLPRPDPKQQRVPLAVRPSAVEKGDGGRDRRPRSRQRPAPGASSQE